MSDSKAEAGIAPNPKKKKQILRNVLIIVCVVIFLAVGFIVVAGISAANFDKHFETAFSFYQSNDYDNALAELDKAIKTIAAFADGYLLRANVYLIKGEYQLAIDDYTKALQFIPRYTKKWDTITSKQKDEYAYAGRGTAYAQTREYELALSDLTKAIELNPDNENAKLFLEDIRKTQGQ